MIRKMVLSHDSANDVLQNTYIRIFKGIENFKEKSKLSTWIYRIAYNESIRFLTNESKLKKVELDSNDDNYSRKLYADEYFDAENLSLKFHQILSSFIKFRYHKPLASPLRFAPRRRGEGLVSNQPFS